MCTIHDGEPELARLSRLRKSQIKGLLVTTPHSRSLHQRPERPCAATNPACRARASPKREPRPNRRRAGFSGTLIGAFRGSQRGSGELSRRIGLHPPDSSGNKVTIEHRRAFGATDRLEEEVAESNDNLHRAQAPAVLDHSRTVPQGDGRAVPVFTRRAVDGECNLIVLDPGEPRASA